MKKHWLSLAIAGFGLDLNAVSCAAVALGTPVLETGFFKKIELPALYRAGILAVPQ
jgi:hypothetical protein